MGTALPGDLAVWDGHVAMIVNGITVEAGNLSDHLVDDRQAEATPGVIAGAGFVEADEAPQHPLAFGFGDAAPVVVDCQHHVVAEIGESDVDPGSTRAGPRFRRGCGPPCEARRHHLAPVPRPPPRYPPASRSSSGADALPPCRSVAGRLLHLRRRHVCGRLQLTDRTRHGPQLSSWGPFGDYGWRPGAGAARGIVYGVADRGRVRSAGADPSHRVKLGFVFLTCVLSVFSGQ